MAIDEALLLNYRPGESMPVLRLYGWSPPALSLGRYQDVSAIDLRRCREDGLPIVRRVTGGGAIYHADELTYALVCAPGDLPLATSIKESFRVLTGFLLDAYRRLGLAAAYAVDAVPPHVQLGGRTHFCFAGHESYDILVNGRKLGGNAQRRLKHAVFQHGSIPLRNRAGDGGAYMRQPPKDIVAVTTSLREEGVAASEEELASLLTASFAATLGVELLPVGLTAAEQQAAARLRDAKYLADAWNQGGEIPEERMEHGNTP